MNYVVIDLEMCKVPKMYRNKMYKYATEIIEIGTVLLNEDFRAGMRGTMFAGETGGNG